MSTQFCTFKVGSNLFGIPVLDAQEVIMPIPVTKVPLADARTRGLINLRGQIVTLLGLREIFGMKQEDSLKYMNVVVRADDALFALVVDEINDVLDVEDSNFESTPSTVSPDLRPFVSGIYKLSGELLIILDLNKLLNF